MVDITYVEKRAAAALQAEPHRQQPRASQVLLDPGGKDIISQGEPSIAGSGSMKSGNRGSVSVAKNSSRNSRTELATMAFAYRELRLGRTT